MPGLFIVDEHETAVAFAEKNDHGGKLRLQSLDLGIGTDANLQVITFFGFASDRLFNGIDDRKVDRVAIKFSPLHMIKGFSNLMKKPVFAKSELPRPQKHQCASLHRLDAGG